MSDIEQTQNQERKRNAERSGRSVYLVGGGIASLAIAKRHMIGVV